ARLRGGADDSDHSDRAPDPWLHRQDEGVRPRLDHDPGRPAVGDRDGLHLRLQAGLRLEHLRPRLSLRPGLGLVRGRPRVRHGPVAAVPAAGAAGVLTVALGARLRRLVLLLGLGLYTAFVLGPVVWLAIMSVRT